MAAGTVSHDSTSAARTSSAPARPSQLAGRSCASWHQPPAVTLAGHLHLYRASTSPRDSRTRLLTWSRQCRSLPCWMRRTEGIAGDPDEAGSLANSHRVGRELFGGFLLMAMTCKPCAGEG